MKNFFKVLVAGILGLSASQASARISLEEEMYRSSIDQGTIDAAEVFLAAFPNSAYADEFNALARDMIRQEHRGGTFESTSEEMQIARKGKGKGKAKGKGKGKAKGKGKGHHKGKGGGHHY